MTASADGAIRELVAEHERRGTRQGSFDEYKRIYDTIAAEGPANVLVFGVGRDTGLWLEANRGGKTVFIEHHPKWIALTRKLLPETIVHEVRYRTRRFRWKRMLEQPEKLLMDDLGSEIAATSWAG